MSLLSFVAVCVAAAVGASQSAPERSSDGDVTAAVRQARQLEAAGRLEAAQDALERVLSRQPDAAEALLALGGILEARRHLTGAAGAYECAVRSQPGNAVAHDKLGLALGRLDRVTDAIASFARAAELNPRLFDAHYHLGAARWFTRDFDGAEAPLRTPSSHPAVSTWRRR